MKIGESAEISNLHRTAFSAAALRAAHVLRGAEPKIFRDNFALPLSGMSEAHVLALAARVPPASASTCILRSRFTEDRIAACRERLTQYVILGAGLDSFALRMGDRLEHLTVFEVDDPPFQNWKRERIAALGLVMPPQAHYVPCDFEQASIANALGESGFDESLPCFISWLGVTQYLTPRAIRGTLRWAGSLPPDSEIVLTFLESGARAENLKTSMASTGVEVVSHFSPDEMTGLLLAAGFIDIEHLGPDEANERYFRDRADGLRAPEIQRLVSARVGVTTFNPER